MADHGRTAKAAVEEAGQVGAERGRSKGQRSKVGRLNPESGISGAGKRLKPHFLGW